LCAGQSHANADSNGNSDTHTDVNANSDTDSMHWEMCPDA
jgi:hypothetical protein